MINVINVQIDEEAFPPERAHSSDAGMDLRSPKQFDLTAGSRAVVDTGVHVEIPDGYVGMLKSRSGLNVKHNIVSEGVIDAGYTGSIRVKLYNHGSSAYRVERGDKITQLVIIPIETPEIRIVQSIGGGSRGEKGFGSTGR